MFNTLESKHSLMEIQPIPHNRKIVIGTYSGGPRGGGVLTREQEPHWRRVSCSCGWYYDGDPESGVFLVRRHIQDRKSAQ